MNGKKNQANISNIEKERSKIDIREKGINIEENRNRTRNEKGILQLE